MSQGCENVSTLFNCEKNHASKQKLLADVSTSTETKATLTNKLFIILVFVDVETISLRNTIVMNVVKSDRRRTWYWKYSSCGISSRSGAAISRCIWICRNDGRFRGLSLLSQTQTQIVQLQTIMHNNPQETKKRSNLSLSFQALLSFHFLLFPPPPPTAYVHFSDSKTRVTFGFFKLRSGCLNRRSVRTSTAA